jgi:hypothetical protein
MPFQIREREADGSAEWVAEWPFRPRPHFIASSAYENLWREVRRYVNGEVQGRAFLIAGHRGAGKTTLVRLVVEDLYRASMMAAVDASRAPTTVRQRTLSLQRPLLVKLYGPGLLRSPNTAPDKKGKPEKEDQDHKPEEHKPETEKARPQTEKAEQETGKTKQQPASAKGKKAPDAASHSTPEASATEAGSWPADRTAFVLEQITIGLYRALATEFGRSFANHARENIRKAGPRRNGTADDLELAGQFTLELDNAPRAATLRGYYERLGRIASGVLWPFEIGESLLESGVNDQGIREMVAMATAAQAFEVCTGEITDKETKKDTRTRDDSTETKVAAELKDVANKFLGLAAGLVVGVGSISAGANIGAAAAAGVAAAVLSAFTLTWSSKRSVKNEREFDYTFIRDRTKQSLERDLPLVVQRIRDAGLAPVFVLDELDKLPDTKTSITDLISGLKHLTTDYGCFCFLTDRDYYDYVMDTVTQKAFPIEHTLFSLRLFVLYQPRQVLDYLRQITQPVTGSPPTVTPSAPTGSDAWIKEITARSSFGLFVLHRSKLNVSDLVRKVAQECNRDGLVRPTEEDLRRDRGYLLPASIQLLIGLILEGTRFRDHIEDDAWFMQLAINALYMISRAWEAGRDSVRIDRKAIMDTLLARWGHAAVDDADAAEKALAKLGVGPRYLGLLGDAVSQLADVLCYQDRREHFLGDKFSPEENYLHDIFPSEMLLSPGESPEEYKFLFDIYGQDIATRTALAVATAEAAVAGLPQQITTQVDAAVAFSRAFDLALRTAGIEIADLVALRILPTTMDAPELAGAHERLEGAGLSGKPYPNLAKDLPTLVSLSNWVEQNGRALAVLFELAIHVAQDATISTARPLATALRAVSRYVDIGSIFSPTTAAAAPDPIFAIEGLPFSPEDIVVVPNGTASRVRGWEAEIMRPRKYIVELLSVLAESAWSRWLRLTRGHLTGGNPVVEPVTYADIVCAAAGVRPGSLSAATSAR